MTLAAMNGHQAPHPATIRKTPPMTTETPEPPAAVFRAPAADDPPFTRVPRLRRLNQDPAPAPQPDPLGPDGPGYELIGGPHYDPPKYDPPKAKTSPATAGPGWFARHRPPRAAYAAVPVLLVNACAFLGQLGYLRTHLTAWGLPGQILVALTLESIAIYLSAHAHLARLADDAAFRLQVAAYALAAVIGAMNYSHWCGPRWHPTPIAITFALFSTVSPWLWGIFSRRESRDALKAKGLIEGHAVRLGVSRWFWYPLRSIRVTRLAAWEGITSPGEAIALDRAAELPAADVDPALLAAMSARDRLIWAWGVIGTTDIPKAAALLASNGVTIDQSHARTIRKQLETAAAATAIGAGQQ